jgi:hypothetical protein
MSQELLKFVWRALTGDAERMFAALPDNVNSLPWRGRAARTCKVVAAGITEQAGGTSAGEVVVRYRPEGWTVRRIDRAEGGRLLDGHGGLLPEGREPVTRESVVYGEADFNRFDFGRLVEGVEGDG